jgi:hypothetical protein
MQIFLLQDICLLQVEEAALSEQFINYQALTEIASILQASALIFPIFLKTPDLTQYPQIPITTPVGYALAQWMEKTCITAEILRLVVCYAGA